MNDQSADCWLDASLREELLKEKTIFLGVLKGIIHELCLDKCPLHDELAAAVYGQYSRLDNVLQKLLGENDSDPCDI